MESKSLMFKDKTYGLHQLPSSPKASNTSRDPTLLEYFESQKCKTPQNVAIMETFSTKSLTYEKLYSAAQKLSFTIKTVEITAAKPVNEFVAILLPQGISFIKSILGIWLAGKIPVPLSVDYPIDQLKYILEEDLGNPLIITTSDILDMIGLKVESQIISPNKLVFCENGLSTLQESIPPQCHEIAYCFFTSGSTGRPKGVLVRHSSYVNVINWAIETCTITDADRSLLFCSPVFDVSILEIWPLLSVGGCLCIPPNHYRYDVQFLKNWIHEYKITFTALPTAVAVRMLADEQDENQTSKLNSLRWMLIGGEALLSYPPAHLPFHMLNLYGPTETAVLATFIIFNEHNRSSSPPPIGKAINNKVKIYVVETGQNIIKESNCGKLITEPDITGEICIGGFGVAKGYLNRPELTNDKFIQNPWEVGTLIYKSGDLGYWNSDGNLCYVGRIDNQIKFHGFRIELGNIEKTLTGIASGLIIEHAIVLMEDEKNEEEMPTTKHLTAYCCLKKDYFNNDFEQSIANLRENLYSYLKTCLAHYEIPSKIYILPPSASFPLTTAGKINRKEIPNLKFDAILIKSRHAPLETKAEIVLGQIWSDLLNIKLDSIGKYDNFFALGGNSIIALQMLHKLKDMMIQTGLNVNTRGGLQLHHIFRVQNIHGLAQLIEEASNSNSSNKLNNTDENAILAIIQNGFESQVPLSYPQQLIWSQMSKTEENEWFQWNQAILLKFTHVPNKEMLTNSIGKILKRHDILNYTINWEQDNNKVFLVKQSSSPSHLQIIDLSETNCTRSESNQILMKNASISLINKEKDSTGPLVNFYILKVGPTTYNIHIIGHQLLLDVTSFNIIIWELQVLIRSQLDPSRNDEAEELEIKPEYQYEDFVLWQEQYFKAQECQASIQFWKLYLENWTCTTTLELLKVNSSITSSTCSTYAGLILPFQLDTDLTQKIKIFTKEQHTTVFNMLLTTFKILLYYYTNQKVTDLSILSIGLGRDHVEFAETVGHFTNPIIIRTRNLQGSSTFESLLQQIQQNATEVYEHGKVPFEKVVKEVFDFPCNNGVKFDHRQLFNFCIQMIPRSPKHLISVRNIFQIYETDFNAQQLMLTFEEDASDNYCIDGFLEADTNIFSSVQLEQIIQDFKFILMNGIIFPNKTIDELLRELTIP